MLPSPARSCRNKVELAVTSRGMGGAAGYHTSVLVNGVEFFFTFSGINAAQSIESHDVGTKVALIGYSPYSGADLRHNLRPYFKAGTYDILRKNCNSFSDAAMFFLCGCRLSWSLRAAEQFGRIADDSIGLVQAIYGPAYGPNPKAEHFDLDSVITAIRVLKKSPDSDDGSFYSDIDAECITMASDQDSHIGRDLSGRRTIRQITEDDRRISGRSKQKLVAVVRAMPKISQASRQFL